ncbi:MAG: chorismate mutase [Rhizobacter sp.]|nr:chorismate mutase [Rhizobacter sp.]
MTVNQELLEIRKSIDNLDNALVAVLAERFRLTERVGFLKRDLNLPPEDRERESAQEKHYSELASSYGLDRATLIEIMRTIISQVKRRHVEIRAGAVRQSGGDASA